MKGRNTTAMGVSPSNHKNHKNHKRINESRKQTTMIAYVKGPITKKTPTYVIVEAGGIGYHINISLYTHAQIETNVTVQLLTHTNYNMREGGQDLYGFIDELERDMFVKLTSVSGVGPNAARILLSSMTPQEARTAIISEDVRTLNAVKGIGPKTAKRLIIELKDKLLKDSGEGENTFPTAAGNQLREEALSALTTLGFNRIRVQKTLNKVLVDNPKVPNSETLIKLALKALS